MGQSMDNLTDQSSRLEIYNLFVSYMPTIKQSYTTYVNYRKDNNYLEKRRSSISAGLDSSFRIDSKTNLGLNFQAREYKYTNRDYVIMNFDLRLMQTLWNNHKISAHGRYSSSGNRLSKLSEYRNTSAIMLEYIVPLKLPVSRKKDIGMVKGHVYNNDTKKPIPDVIIMLGKVIAVTDKDGYFVFPSLKPGTYKLNVNTSSIGIGYIVSPEVPKEVTVKDNKETKIEIWVTQSAVVSGQVMVYVFEDNNNNGYLNNNKNGEAKLVESHGLANTLVELINEKEAKSLVTDRDGSFSFEGLHPGKWTLKVSDNDLPENHYFDKNSIEFNLKPAEKADVFIKVLPKIRRIKILEENGTTGVDAEPTEKVISKKAESVEIVSADEKTTIKTKTDKVVSDVASNGVGKYMNDQAEEMQKEVPEAKMGRVGQDEESKINLTFGSEFLFDTDKSTLKPNTIVNINKLAEILRKYPDTNILVEGHTDSVGGDYYNMVLSKKRAKEVSNYLIQQKVDLSRITVKWYGKAKPIADNKTVEGRQQNRRVEITITPNDKLKQGSAKTD
jgi:outer membrane protein OmpA-like peptidoglycan-associated protein